MFVFKFRKLERLSAKVWILERGNLKVLQFFFFRRRHLRSCALIPEHLHNYPSFPLSYFRFYWPLDLGGLARKLQIAGWYCSRMGTEVVLNFRWSCFDGVNGAGSGSERLRKRGKRRIHRRQGSRSDSENCKPTDTSSGMESPNSQLRKIVSDEIYLRSVGNRGRSEREDRSGGGCGRVNMDQ